MQIKCIKSITPKSEYFQEILLTDGENMFYNSKNNVFIHDGKQTMTFPIKKSYYCLFIDGFAYVVNEHGSLYCINLKDQHCTVLQKNFGVDCNLYRVFDNKLLVSAKHNEFYRKAYIVNHTDVKEICCQPKYCWDILGLGNQIYFVSINSLKERNRELSLYRYPMNNDSTPLYKTLKDVPLTNYSIEPNNNYIAYANGKKIEIFDFAGTHRIKFKAPETVYSINWISNGKYFLISAMFTLYIYDGEDFSLIKKVEFPKSSRFLDVKCNYDSHYLCAITNDETTLFAVD